MQTFQFTFLLLSGLVTRALSFASISPTDSEFVAAVYEHVFLRAENTTVVLSKQKAVAIVMRNMDVYEIQIQKAKQQNASIIVFPEYGLTGFGYTRESFRSFLEDIPDPKKISLNPCQNPQANNSTPIMYRLSCLAKTYRLYLVVNMGDIKPCLKETDKHCPPDGRYQYNTNVVFDDEGKLVARYHKQHPFRNEMESINRPYTPEYITFETPFGKFGTFICYDVLFHDPAVPLVTEHKIDHVVFPTAWFDVLPLLSAIGFHGSWARGMEVNFLSANTHLPPDKSTGSGIYSPTGVKQYYRSLSGNGSLSVAALPKKPRHIPRNRSTVETEKIQQINTNEDSFYAKLNRDPFLFKELKNQEETLDVCYNGSKTCCSLKYKMKTKRVDEMYAVGVYDGLHGRYHARICTLIKCLGLSRDSCGQRAHNALTIFESFTLKGQLNTRFVFPQVVADGVSLLPGEWDHSMPVTHLQTKQRLSKGLLTAALFGRVYELDGGATVESSGPHVSGHFTLVCFVAMVAYLEGKIVK